jgi:hypothetical protein
MNPTKEQREAKQDKSYVGNGKELVFNAPAPVQQDAPRPNDMESLPF